VWKESASTYKVSRHINPLASLGTDGNLLTALWYFYASFNLLTDILCWALPIPVLAKLILPRRQKYTLMFVFTLGLFGCIIGILRMYYLYRATVSTDLTYDNVAAAMWSAIELNVGIVCACVPALRPVVAKVLPSLVAKTRSWTGTGKRAAGRAEVVPERTSDDQDLVIRKEPATKWRDLEEGRNDENASDTGSIHVKREWSIIMEVAELDASSTHHN
jgi:hypothetical protein